jgi:carbon monoxide dehydrogenase subunit G
MTLTGKHALGASQETAYRLLLDPATLQACLPGCERLNQVAADRFEAVMKLGIAGLRGTFSGKVTIKDQVPPEAFTLALEARGPTGLVKAEGRIVLRAAGPTRCEVDWTGDVRVTGVMAAVGPRIIGGAATMMAGQFFDALERRLPPPGGPPGPPASA